MKIQLLIYLSILLVSITSINCLQKQGGKGDSPITEIKGKQERSDSSGKTVIAGSYAGSDYEGNFIWGEQ